MSPLKLAEGKIPKTMGKVLKKAPLLLGLFVIGILMRNATARIYAQQTQPRQPIKSSNAPPAKTGTTKSTVTASPSGTEEEILDQRIADHIRATFNVSPEVELTVVSRSPSKLMGLDTVTVELNDGVNTPRRLEVLLTGDNKFALMPQIFDLSVDPFVQKMKQINLTNVPIRGNRYARVTIVEYSDFECPMCGQAYHMIEDQVLKQYGEKVRIIYKNYPLPNHPWAESAAIAGLCAFQQSNDAFWTFYRAFFENQSSIMVETVRSKAVDTAASAKIDVKKFENCYDNKSTLTQLQSDVAEAASLNISGTPLFMINGRPVPGAVPFSVFQKVIEKALKQVPY